MVPNAPPDWQVQDRFLTLHSRWMTLIGEHWLDAQGQPLEYWRIEKADSVIVLPLQADSLAQPHLLLPPASYRPGIGQATLDFPGGRCLAEQSPREAAIAILQRELGIAATSILQITPLNTEGWPINSSFSNQRLFGFVVHIHPDHPVQLPSTVTYPAHAAGIARLLSDLVCLQCRAVLLDWYIHQHPSGS
jgi:hypothetical protein